MKGRKKKQESRAQEIRARLLVWKQSPETLRPSLRELARELSTSHQLLQHYLDGLEEWECRERYERAKESAERKAEEIRARVEAEGREMTTREAIDVIVTPGLHERIERIRQEARRGPLHPGQFKILKLWAKQGFPGAKVILGSCRQMTPQEERQARASERAAGFAAAATKTIKRIKQDGERGPLCWQDIERLKYLARRKYAEAKELLRKYSQTAEPKPNLELSSQTAVPCKDTAKAAAHAAATLKRQIGKNNLPPIPCQTAKSFRSGDGDTGNSANAVGRRSDALV